MRSTSLTPSLANSPDLPLAPAVPRANRLWLNPPAERTCAFLRQLHVGSRFIHGMAYADSRLAHLRSNLSLWAEGQFDE